MIWLTAILTLFLYAPLAEYAVHRWVMHRPLLGKGPWWRSHAIEHHGKGRLDINIDISALSVLLAASPLLSFAYFLGWPWIVIVLMACILYSALWSTLHATHHGISGSWVEGLGFYSAWKQHHLRHHELPNRYFGTVFIFTDRMFGSV